MTREFNKRMSYSGYDLPFEPEPDPRFHCPVCLAVLKQPVQTKCGHRFCKGCLQSIAAGYSRPIKCPIDKTSIHCSNPRDLFIDVATEREVLSLTLKCSNFNIGCNWRGELRDIYKHLEECLEDMMMCDLNCGMRFRRLNKPDHPTKCPKRLVHCPYCDLETTAVDLPKHQLLRCMKLPVECMLCGNNGMLREAIPAHIDGLEGDCPAVIINCKFDQLGCSYQEQRCNMAMHYSSASIQHLTLVGAAVKDNEKLLNEVTVANLDVKNSVQALERNRQDKDKLMETLSTNHNALKNEVAELKCAPIPMTGKSCWKIKLSSIFGDNKKIVGPIFYTGNPGYKIQAIIEYKSVINMEPNEFTEPIPVPSFEVLAGTFDETLPPYFSGQFQVSIIHNQDEEKSVKNKIKFTRRCNPHFGNSLEKPTLDAKFPAKSVLETDFQDDCGFIYLVLKVKTFI